MRSRPVILFTALSVLTVGLFLLDLAVGAVRIPVGDVWAALTGGDCPRTTAKIVFISAVTGQGLTELKDMLWRAVTDDANRLATPDIATRDLDALLPF